MVLEAHVTASRGQSKVLKILIDTGAEVNLIKPGIFPASSFQPAANPLKLVTVNGSALQGGQMTIPLVLHLQGEHPKTGKTSHHLLGGLFYEADIGWDAIISYQMLQDQKIGVLPNQHCLMLDHGDHFILLRGGSNCANKCPKILRRLQGKQTLSSSKSCLLIYKMTIHHRSQMTAISPMCMTFITMCMTFIWANQGQQTILP